MSRLRRLALCALAALLLGGLFLGLANRHILTAHRDRVRPDLAAVPSTEVALVLGCSPRASSGGPNLHFTHRIAAAAELYHAGKVRHLLVSGANPDRTYDEPTAMRDALVARGVPATAITRDFAGLRTLDSVVRARAVFGVEELVIVSQRYHLDRALAIAAHHGVDATGYPARDVPRRFSSRTELREILARALVVLDLHLWHRQPRFPGPPEPIAHSSS